MRHLSAASDITHVFTDLKLIPFTSHWHQQTHHKHSNMVRKCTVHYVQMNITSSGIESQVRIGNVLGQGRESNPSHAASLTAQIMQKDTWSNINGNRRRVNGCAGS